MNINLLGVVRFCRAFTPLFKQQGSGYFVNIASMAGLLHPPMMGSYNATKAAVVALSECLRVELVSSNIGVTVVCPSFFKTNLAESLRTSETKLVKSVNKLLEKKGLTADDIAEVVYNAHAKGDFMVMPHKEARRAHMLKRFLPYNLYLNLFIKQFRR